MGKKTNILAGVFLFLCMGGLSQDYFSYGADNFGGLTQVFANPATAVDNRLKLDLVIGGLDFNLNNSWFGIKRKALEYSGTLKDPINVRLPGTWKNVTPNTPDNLFKNFSVVGSSPAHAVIIEGRLLLPSVLVQLNSKNALGFTWSARQIANVDGISSQLGNLFENEMDLNVVQNNKVQNKNLSAVQMSWAEYGLTYARVLKDNNQHFFKAGITPKILQGLESGYLIVRDLDFLLSTRDSLSYFDVDFSVARSANFISPARHGQPAKEFYHRVSKPAVGLDLGVIYEWRPAFRKYRYKMGWRRDLNKYRLKLGASLVDVGKIKFATSGESLKMDVHVDENDINDFVGAKDLKAFDSLVNVKFPQQKAPPEFTVLLPTAVNTQIDLCFNRFFYLNLSSHLTGFYRSNLYKVHNYTAICVAPRFEHYWFTATVPFTYNALSADRNKMITTGLNIRLGDLSVGSNDVPALFKGDVSAINLYAIFRVAIPYPAIRDRDGDGVKDKKDACPDDSGNIALKGCPDKDGDLIIDNDDACPNQAGVSAFKGCPDTDGDGIKDADDLCPTIIGPVYLKGCPDADGDSIADKDDGCPDKKGPKVFKGCPDTDKDGIIDKEDHCPTAKGLAKNHGCPDTDRDQVYDDVDECITVAGSPENKGCPWPDTDKDGIIDRLDSCVTTPGIAEFKGCPAPPVLAPVEKRILEKAYSSLEFETGKDIIKPASIPSLKALAKLLNTHKDDWTIKLSGHTDNEGTEEGNVLLSEKRAKAVQNYLVKQGVLPENITLEWFGQSRPIASNQTKQGQKKNRRVEMTLMMKVD